MVALAIGIPTGILAGLAIWRRFAGNLGIVLESQLRPSAVAAMIVGGLLAALLLSVVPARTAIPSATDRRAAR